MRSTEPMPARPPRDQVTRKADLGRRGTPRREPLTFLEPADKAVERESLGLVLGLRIDIWWPGTAQKGPHPWYQPRQTGADGHARWQSHEQRW